MRPALPVALLGPDGARARQRVRGDRPPSRPTPTLPWSAEDYPDLFRTTISRIAWCGGRDARASRVRIYGPLEARLQSVDRVVLGALVEGVWPPETRSDPWLSRPMRHALGLDLPERRISLSAHDFAQALGADEVILAYPAKLGGAPTVTSRFVQRLAAVAGEERWKRARRTWREISRLGARARSSHQVKRADKPAPKPPRAARPTTLSVTEIESWLRDPYTIYARHILELRELDPVDLPPGAADRGIVIHGALSEFTKTFAAGLPADPAARADRDRQPGILPRSKDYPEARAFWWPRFQRIARWFGGWETQRGAARSRRFRPRPPARSRSRWASACSRCAAAPTASSGSPTAATPSSTTRPGRCRPSKQVRIGVSPQLTLEAAILRGGGFPGIPRAPSVAELVYVSLKGGEPRGRGEVIDFKDGDADTHADARARQAPAGRKRFEDEQQPYLPLVLSMWKSRYGTYDHLARVKEWSVGA